MIPEHLLKYASSEELEVHKSNAKNIHEILAEESAQLSAQLKLLREDNSTRLLQSIVHFMLSEVYLLADLEQRERVDKGKPLGNG